MITEPSVGTEIVYNCEVEGHPLDLAPYTGGRWLIFRDTARVETQKAADILNAPGDDGKLVYRKEAGFLDRGKWMVRPRLMIDPAHDFYGEWKEITVGP